MARRARGWAGLMPAQGPLSISPVWTPERAHAWYSAQPWLVGSCYVPSTAVNQIEMWRGPTFDPTRIETELSWAEALGLNTVRVFLHDLVWSEDSAGLLDRLERFLQIADGHRIRPMFVLFDSCWDPDPHAGPQPAARPGVCMSRWVQGPGTRALEDPDQHPRLREYVEGVVSHFAHDDRVLAWDLWNEPDHLPDHQTSAAYGPGESREKVARVTELLPQVFDWARRAGPGQPMTSGLWNGDWADPGRLRPVERLQLALSDFVSFHSYEPAAGFEAKARALGELGRPVMCTEYMARGQGSTFQGTLPIARRLSIGAVNWGFVAGRTQSYLPWDSWLRPYDGHPPQLWFHDVLRPDGTPFDPRETEYLRSVLRPAAASARTS